MPSDPKPVVESAPVRKHRGPRPETQKRVPRRIFQSTQIPETEVVRWVFNNYAVADVTAAEAPSPGAWALLQACREDPTMWRMFLQTIWPKLLPSKTELQREGTSSSRTKRLLDVIAFLEETLKAHETSAK